MKRKLREKNEHEKERFNTTSIDVMKKKEKKNTFIRADIRP